MPSCSIRTNYCGWKNHLGNNQYVRAIFMDLSKAFDCLPHELLVAKLAAYGFDKSTLKFFHNYLKERKQAVSIKGELSEFMDILAGVPQGSILGPVLFNIFINDMMYIFENTKITNFADDNSLSKVAKTIEHLVIALEKDSKIAIDWYEENHMIANADKFHAIVLNRKGDQTDIPFNINGEIIKSEKDVILLGLTIDNRLSLSKHINQLCKSAANQLNSIKRLKRHLTRETKSCMAKTFVMSQFNYCPLVWHFCMPGDTHKMEKIQERALRFIYNEYTSDYSKLLEENGETTLYLKRVRIIAHEVYKAINGISPKYMKELLKTREKTLRRP